MEDSANALRPPLPTVERATYATRNEQYWHRNLIVCVFGSFTTLVSLSMLLPFLPLYVQQLGVTSTSADGRPIENVSVTATSLTGNVNRTAKTDRNGRYTILFPEAEGD